MSIIGNKLYNYYRFDYLREMAKGASGEDCLMIEDLQNSELTHCIHIEGVATLRKLTVQQLECDPLEIAIRALKDFCKEICADAYEIRESDAEFFTELVNFINTYKR